VALPEVLRDLLTAAGPPGHEEAPVTVWRDAAAGFAEVTTDPMGTPAARVDGTGDGPLLLISGHIDEIALLVSHIDDKGFLKAVSSGGWDPQILVGQRVEVLTRNGPVSGVVGRKPTHLLEDEERNRAVQLKDLHVDIGAADGDEAKRTVAIGDPLVIDAQPVELPNGRLTSRSLDNRLGAYVALEAVRLVAEAGGAHGPVAAVGAVQEEIGAYGARAAAFGLEPGLALAVDVTHATDAPGVEPGRTGAHALGDGPVIGRGPVLNPRISELLMDAADDEGIAYTIEAAGRGTWTDADELHWSRSGVPTGGVWIPLRYMHSPVELVQLSDVEATAKLIAAFAMKLGPETSLARW
jgi:putative aminopeptidase FrvX